MALVDPFIMLNMDGSSLGNLGRAGAKGLLRDSSGKWISGFSLNLGITSNNVAELGAIWYGLQLALNMGFKFMHVQIDSMVVLA